uniref:Uncharacterized protein n=1 Tax=Fagus sylvatica TaxID=28930 RepID=A0A2N9G490_FAGSY
MEPNAERLVEFFKMILFTRTNGGTSGHEQEVQMPALERKFDDLLAFVHMMVKRDAEMGNQKRKDGKSTNGEVSEGRPRINMDLPPRPQTPPKPEGRDFQFYMPPKFKVPKLEKNNGRNDSMIHLQMYCWKMAQYTNNEPLMIQTFQGTLDRAHSRVFLVDLIPVEERIKDAGKTKEIMDTPALMALVEQIAKRTLVEKNEGKVQMIAKNDGKWRRTLPCYTHLESAKVGSDSTSSQGA